MQGVLYMQTNTATQAPKTGKSASLLKIVIVPTYTDEDPELTPERWWARRQQQSLSGL